MIISAGGVAGQYYSWKGNPLGCAMRIAELRLQGRVNRIGARI
jgi:hypothetical protein